MVFFDSPPTRRSAPTHCPPFPRATLRHAPCCAEQQAHTVYTGFMLHPCTQTRVLKFCHLAISAILQFCNFVHFFFLQSFFPFLSHFFFPHFLFFLFFPVKKINK